MKFELVDKLDRAKLSEGRDYGMGFAFCKREDDKLITVNALTACKDFLNEVIASEHTGKEYCFYGLKTKKQEIFNYEVGYLVITMLKQGRGLVSYDNFARDLKALKSNCKNLQKFINWFEDKIIEKKLMLPKTKISKLEDNRYLVEVPLFWCQYTYLISLYTLLLRVGVYWDGKSDVMDYLKNFDKDYNDSMLLKGVLDKINLILEGFIPEQNLLTCNYIHNCGIQGFTFPAKKKEIEEKAIPVVQPVIKKPKAKSIPKPNCFDSIWTL